MPEQDPMLTPITLYSKPSCVQCTATERWLKSKNLRYIKHDVSESDVAYNFISEMGYKQVPVVVVPFGYGEQSGQHWSGFNPSELDKLLTI